MRKIILITIKTAILLIITGSLLKLMGLNISEIIKSPFIFFSEETARNLDNVNEPYNGWNEENFQKYLEENFIQDEDGFYKPN